MPFEPLHLSVLHQPRSRAPSPGNGYLPPIPDTSPMKRSISTLTPPQRPQLYEYSLEKVPHERSHQHHHRCHRRKERKQKSTERSPQNDDTEAIPREKRQERGRSQERKQQPPSSNEKQRFYSCDRYGSRESGHPRHSDHSRATSPSSGIDHGTNRQGSGSASGSPRLTSSGASTPCRGMRRQLPQTPLTPRPSVTYRTAHSSPVHFGGLAYSPGRLSRGLSEHNTLMYSDSPSHSACTVTRIGSDPYLGPRQESESYSPVPEDTLTFEEALASNSGRSSRTSYVSSLTSHSHQLCRVPNGYHYTLGLSTGPGTAPRGRSYYHEADEDDWC